MPWCNLFSVRAGRDRAAIDSAPPSSPNAEPGDDELRLIERKTVEGIEQEHTRRFDDLRMAERRSPERIAALLKPFGYSNREWETLKAGMQPGDELWTFVSSPASWRAMAGRAGVAAVRNGEIVATMTTMMN